jgi:hypothetical protein
MNINDNVLIQCPLRRFNLRKARHCLDCEHYGGFVQPVVNGKPIENATIDQFQIICEKPISRKLVEIEAD